MKEATLQERPESASADLSTREVAQWLGLAVRSVQLMVDRGELEAWKTPGGHRRIQRRSVERWLAQRGGAAAPARPREARCSVLCIEDSVHFQRLIGLVVAQHFPNVELHVASDGVAGLAMAGQLRPQLLLVDILLPGIDGATLINGLRAHPAFADMHLIVLTSLDEAQRAPYALALQGIPVVHKSKLVTELPLRMREALALP